jgi:hypothetical protein
MCGYFRRFVPNFSDIALPLIRVSTEKSTFRMGVWELRAFEELKSRLTQAPILKMSRRDDLYVLYTDASNTGIGAILTQHQDGEEVVISYASKALGKGQRNNSATEKECYAVVWATEEFRPYLYGVHFKVVTDHSALQWLLSFRGNNQKLIRWSLRLSEYSFDV